MDDIAPAADLWAQDPVAQFRAALQAHGLLVPGAARGVYARGAVFERVVQAVGALVGGLAEGPVETVHFPPMMGRSAFEATRYYANFPHLAATIHCFCGGEDAHLALLDAAEGGRDWTEGRKATEVVLTPASCYPVYGMVAARGPLPEQGWQVDSSSWCFRHEPSDDPVRMLGFRQREQVFLGTDAQVEAFRQRWVARATAMFAALRLPAIFSPATDPFFGRLGSFLARSQEARRAKHEFTLPISDPARPNACGSFNAHGEHFARAFGVRTADGSIAQTACAGFGLERLALALFRQHGFVVEAWPQEVRESLCMPA